MKIKSEMRCQKDQQKVDHNTLCLYNNCICYPKCPKIYKFTLCTDYPYQEEGLKRKSKTTRTMKNGKENHEVSKIASKSFIERQLGKITGR